MSNTTHERDARLWQRSLSANPSAGVRLSNLRNVTVDDVPALGTLFFWAFLGTIDDAGEAESQYSLKAAAIFGGRYEEWIPAASWAIEEAGNILSACLVCDYKPYGCPVIAVVATTPSRKRSGDGRTLVNAAAMSLAALDAIECCAMIAHRVLRRHRHLAELSVIVSDVSYLMLHDQVMFRVYGYLNVVAHYAGIRFR